MSKAKQIPASQQQQQAAATYSKYLQQDLNTRQKALSQYTEFKQEYHDLQTTLRDLPSEIEYDAMVPVGPLAFFPGKLVHTNEILVLLGDNWFVERSASQAADIAQRREEFVTEKIEQLRKELSEVVKRKDI
ncbi:Prefoldin, partial [Martensiomyces pterosporus]